MLGRYMCFEIPINIPNSLSAPPLLKGTKGSQDRAHTNQYPPDMKGAKGTKTMSQPKKAAGHTNQYEGGQV